MPLIRPPGRKSWYIRISYQEEGKEKQRWHSLHIKEKPSSATVARVESELWREVNVDKRRSEGLAPIQHRGKAGEAVRKYIEFMEPRFSRGHIIRIKKVLYNVLSFINSTSLEAWTFEALQRYFQEGLTRTGWAADARRPWSARTHNLHLVLLHGFFKWAIRNNLADENPTKEIKRLRQIVEEPEIHSREDIEKVLNAGHEYDIQKARGGPWLERAVRIALHTGARLGELIAAEWSWVSLAHNRIISHALMSGVGIRQVQKWSGHESISTTERYAHILKSQEDEDIKRLPRL